MCVVIYFSGNYVDFPFGVSIAVDIIFHQLRLGVKAVRVKFFNWMVEDSECMLSLDLYTNTSPNHLMDGLID